MVTLQTAKDNLTKFIDNLDASSIQFLYFSPSKIDLQNLKPQLRINIKKWDNNFIANGSYKGWCYVYKNNNLRRLIQLNDDNTIEIVGYVKDNNYAEFKGGSIVADIGNHITFGIEGQRTGNILIKTHKTTYDENIDNPSSFSRNQIDCNFILNGQIDNTSQCEYKFYTDNPPIITINMVYGEDLKIIKDLVDIVLNNKTVGGNKYYVYRGHRYIVRNGKNGGKYIKLKDGS